MSCNNVVEIEEKVAEGVENIGKKDVMWGYISTIFLAGAGVILLPAMMHYWNPQEQGIWQIFQSITLLVTLLDFGFKQSFSRNITYIFSGVTNLQKEGVNSETATDKIDYSLLKGTLNAMRKFYRWMALGAFLILLIGGTAYVIFEIMPKYDGSRTNLLIAWILLIVFNCYQLFTLYYDTLLFGKGLIKRTQQITIIGQSAYLLTAFLLLRYGGGLTAVVSAQIVSIIIRRFLAGRVFFTPHIKEQLNNVTARPEKEVLSAIFPNAVKTGLTHLGGFCVNQSAVFFGTHFLTLAQMGSFGITHRVIMFISLCGLVVYQSLMPKLANVRVSRDLVTLKKYYIICVAALVVIVITGGISLITLAPWIEKLFHSQTQFLPKTMIAAMVIIQLLEQNHVIAAGFIMADNKIPFFIPSLVSGAATICLHALLVGYLGWGVWGMILAPGIAQLAYQNWKWPSVIIKEIHNANLSV